MAATTEKESINLGVGVVGGAAGAVNPDDNIENEEKVEENVILDLNKNFSNIALVDETANNNNPNNSLADVSKPMPEIDDWIVPEHIKKDYVIYRAGYDLQNRPLWIVDVRTLDLKKLVRTEEEKELFLKYIRKTIRSTIRSIEDKSTPGNPVDGAAVLIDFAGLKVSHLLNFSAVSFLLRMCKDYEPHIGYVTKAFGVNVNGVGEAAINLIKPLLGKRFENIEVYGTKSDKWIPKLLKHFDPSQLPESYGGVKGFKPNYDWQ